MKSLSNNLNNYFLLLILAVFTFGVTGCSGDDDVDDIIDEPTGSIVAEDQTISVNTIIVETVIVDQDSWLVAVMGGDEATNNFITEPVMVEEGTSSDIELTLNDDVELMPGETGTEISLKLYADNPDEGTPGEWDASDEPILGADGALATETIIVFTDDSLASFSDFDANSDGVLDNTEVAGIYENNFEEWDTDDDDVLDRTEFDATTFSLTDMNDDDGIDEEEWNDGFTSFFGNWNDDTFGTFDADSDGILDSDEWNNAFTESEWFATFDADDDDFLGEDEWDAGLFDDWDADDNDSIDEDEFNIFSPFAMNW